MDDFIGGIFGLLFVGVIVFFGFLIFTSQGVLYSETPSQGYGFTCSYFTGTRTVEQETGSSTGCARFIKVGG